MSTYHREACNHRATFTLIDLVDDRLHVVLDPPARHAAQSAERTCMGIEQHLVTLARIRHEPERPTGTQLQMRHLHAQINAADQQTFLAPVVPGRGAGQVAWLWGEIEHMSCSGEHSLPPAPPLNKSHFLGENEREIPALEFFWKKAPYLHPINPRHSDRDVWV